WTFFEDTGEAQDVFVSTTDRFMVVPGAPASRVTALVPWPEARFPPSSVQAYVEPSCPGTDAATPVAPTATPLGAVIDGGSTGVPTTISAAPVPAVEQWPSETDVTVYVVVEVGLTDRFTTGDATLCTRPSDQETSQGPVPVRTAVIWAVSPAQI